MNKHPRFLFCTLVDLFTTPYQQQSFKALFLRGDGRPEPAHAVGKSESALSRFLNRHAWRAAALARLARRAAVTSLLEYYATRRGRRARLLIMLDLTTLEKAGRFERLGLVRELNKKRGLHLVVAYLVAGPLRLPWGFRVWRGKGEASPVDLALALLRFNPLVLADGGFGSNDFLIGVRRLGLDAVVGVRRDRRLQDGRRISQAISGERVALTGLSLPLVVARYYLPREGGRETRYALATFIATGRVIARWGGRRWWIEAFFKTAKSRFGLARCAQATRRGAYRYLLLVHAHAVAGLGVPRRVAQLGRRDQPHPPRTRSRHHSHRADERDQAPTPLHRSQLAPCAAIARCSNALSDLVFLTRPYCVTQGG